MKKVMFVASTGGHLDELLQLKSMFDNYDYYLVTERTKSNMELKEDYPNRISYLIYGTKDHKFTYPFKLLLNLFICLFIYIKVHPDYIVTTGAHVGGIMSLVGKIFGSKIIFIETFANISTKTITGSLVYKFADLFIVQWESMLKLYPKAEFGGWIF
ncbi:MAG: polysaccharide biosynthesis protein [Bacilli bacterium]|nr:polysaccharide biosynthesis protein [Bacilli bacterium]